MPTSDGDFPFEPTSDELTFDWWRWVELIADRFSQVARQLGIAVISAGFAIAAGTMFASNPGWAKGSLAVAAVFAVWFAYGVATGPTRGSNRLNL
jgi:hypothetical protein